MAWETTTGKGGQPIVPAGQWVSPSPTGPGFCPSMAETYYPSFPPPVFFVMQVVFAEIGLATFVAQPKLGSV